MVDTVTVNSTDTGPSLEEEAAAQEAAAQTSETPALAGEEPAGDRPEWLPEKFATVEDMAKAYAELEKSQGGQEAHSETAEETSEAAEAAVSEAGLDMDALSNEYAENGELSQESLDALAKVGITADMVDSYIAGQEAQAADVREQLLDPVGGEEAYQEMTAWAADNLDDEAIDAFNAALDSGDMGVVKMAVENLQAKYVAENGAEPQRQLSGKPAGNVGSVYESTAELMKDMQNPAYAKDPAFRAKVEAKLGRSNIM